MEVAAWVALCGLLLSGPLGLALVMAVGPQPPWVDTATFVAHFHPVQGVPYAFGHLLLAGLGTFAAAAAARMPPERLGLGYAGLLFTGVGIVFAALNYVAQIAWLPFASESDSALVAAASMSNPGAFAWGVEMFAYAWIGLGLWLLAPAFPGPGRNAAIRVLLAVNGVVSIAAAIPMGLASGWVLAPPGLVGYLLWNGLMAALLILVIREERR